MLQDSSRDSRLSFWKGELSSSIGDHLDLTTGLLKCAVYAAADFDSDRSLGLYHALILAEDRLSQLRRDLEPLIDFYISSSHID